MVLFKYVNAMGNSPNVMCKDVDTAIEMFKCEYIGGNFLTGYITEDIHKAFNLENFFWNKLA